jgi:hypothetical protein
MQQKYPDFIDHQFSKKIDDIIISRFLTNNPKYIIVDINENLII